LAIFEANLEPHHRYVMTCRANLGLLLLQTNKIEEAESLLKQALSDTEGKYGLDHLDVAAALNNLGWVYMISRRYEEAEPFFRKALIISKSSLGPEHPNVAVCLGNLAQSLLDRGLPAEAELLVDQALLIVESKYGPDHPKVADQLAIMVRVLQQADRLSEMAALLKRSLDIRETTYGITRPSTVMCAYNLALCLLTMNKLAESEPLLRSVITTSIEIKRSEGQDHPHFRTMIAAYRHLLSLQNLPDEEIDARLRAFLGSELAQTILGPFQVMILDVVKDMQAELLGLKPGDVYVSYNEQAITSKEQLIQLTGEAHGESIPVEVLRVGKKMTFTVKPGKLGTVIENRPRAR